MGKIRVGIVGYGNIGKGVEIALSKASDMELTAVFTRRNPESVVVQSENVMVCKYDDAPAMMDKIDVMILCGGSATDLPEQTPFMAKYFTVVDSFDNHGKIPEHFAAVDKEAKAGGNVALISAGWDPGMFSISRVYGDAILPNGETYTFWGPGISQGHSDAIRRVEGVLDARQYTVPIEESVQKVCNGENPELTTRDKHKRVCYVVAKEGADQEAIKKQIVEMPNYFEPYDTEVNFISMEELKEKHSAMPHGGRVLRSGTTGKNDEHVHVVEYSLKLASNPEFTGSILVAAARAAWKAKQKGMAGCITMLDVSPADLSAHDGEFLRKNYL